MLVRVFVKGGIIAPGDLQQVLQVAQALGSDYIHLGSRQDILFPLAGELTDHSSNMLDQLPLPYEVGQKQQQNIVSAYSALDVVPTVQWLAPHIYHYVLDSFDYIPAHKINITDPLQGMVPLFTGNINFVASALDNYWYLYLRYSQLGNQPWCCPELIYGFDLAKVAKAIEGLDPVQLALPYADLYAKLKQQLPFHTHAIEQPLRYPEIFFPYYEGINLIENNKYWMGLYWRNNQFTIKFLDVFCRQCMQCNIGIIGLTPWKSVIVKGIQEKDRLDWEKLLGKYGINMRHSSLELNWHLPVADQEAIELKNYLVRALDQQDISTYGLTFAVKTQKHKILFTSVVIEKAETDSRIEEDSYNLLYAKDFNPNLFEYYVYASGVSKRIIPSLLIELSKQYYEQLQTHKVPSRPEPAVEATVVAGEVQQCMHCLSVYDATYGDSLAGIAAGTPFALLPADYRCPVCGSDKEAFKTIPLPAL